MTGTRDDEDVSAFPPSGRTPLTPRVAALLERIERPGGESPVAGPARRVTVG